MIAPIFRWLLESLPWMAPALVLGALAWYVSRQVSMWNCMLKALSDKIDKKPCERHGEDLADHRSRIDIHISESVARIEEHAHQIRSLESKIERWDDKMMDIALSNAVSVKKNSPYSLTDFGRFMLRHSMGRDCIDANRDYYFGMIDRMPHTTPYDVERSAIGAVMDSFRTDVTVSVKNFLYNSASDIDFDGKRHEFTANDIQMAMAIYLRDLYLRRQSENTVESIG